MSEKYFRQSVQIPIEHKPAIEYLCEKTGLSRSALIAQIIDESIPEMYGMFISAERKLSDDGILNPKEHAMIHALKAVTEFLENKK
jgi:predicted DNA-binding protein